jgi:Holliday junction resolvasome RuvABC endonuclease subunit
MKTIVGIDYSLTCPCISISQEPSYEKSKFYYLTDNKKHADKFGNAEGFFHKEYKTEQERYDNIASFFMSKIPPPDECEVFIEDYSFGSRGKVFHIAENCGILKHKLWQAGYSFTCVPPTVIKKHATGKGNADKEKMVAAFKELTGVDLHDMILGSKKLASPVSDIVDAYYIASYGFSE